MERAWKKPKTAKTTEMMIRIGKLKSSNRFILHTSFFSSESSMSAECSKPLVRRTRLSCSGWSTVARREVSGLAGGD
jgi:hypothetical protein